MTKQNLLSERFEEYRPQLHRLARRMLGSDVEADDALQESWLRVSRAGDEAIENFGGWLTTVTSRVCLNMLRARAARNETAYEDQLGNPVVQAVAAGGDPAGSVQLSDAVETALLLVLDKLSPAERVAFVLHDTFEVPFEQIGQLLERAPEAARQLASRARRRVRAATADAEAGTVSPGAGSRRIVDAFFAAARDGDFDQLVSLLAPEVMLRTDGITSATLIVHGSDQVARRALLFANPDAVLRPVLVDGNTGVIVMVEGTPTSVMGFRIDGGRIAGIDAYTGVARLAGIRLPE